HRRAPAARAAARPPLRIRAGRALPRRGAARGVPARDGRRARRRPGRRAALHERRRTARRQDRPRLRAASGVVSSRVLPRGPTLNIRPGRALPALLLVPIALAAQSPTPSPLAHEDPAPRKVDVRAAPVLLNPEKPGQQTIGRLRYRGGVHLTS